MIIVIKYRDGEIHKIGSSYLDLKWSEIPNKPIDQVFLRLPDNNFLVMQGYDKYICMGEATQDVYGSGNQQLICRNIYLMGYKIGANIINSYRLTVFQSKDSKYKIGDITRRDVKKGKEFLGQPTNPSFWKGVNTKEEK